MCKKEKIEKNGILAVVEPMLSSEWHPTKNEALNPSDLTLGSQVKVWWMCKEGHEWQASVNSRKNAGCPFCGHRKLLRGYSDLKTCNPVLANEWDYEKNNELKPDDVMPNSKKRVWWIGSCGHSWDAPIVVCNNGSGCPYCTGRRVLKGFNDFKSRYPLLVENWNEEFILPEEISYGSDKKINWKCHICKTKWEETPRAYAKRGKCPRCKQ